MDKITVKDARVVIAEAFEKDPNFRRTYRDNIAMLMFDTQIDKRLMDFRDKETRDSLAEKIIDLIFFDRR